MSYDWKTEFCIVADDYSLIEKVFAESDQIVEDLLTYGKANVCKTQIKGNKPWYYYVTESDRELLGVDDDDLQKVMKRCSRILSNHGTILVQAYAPEIDTTEWRWVTSRGIVGIIHAYSSGSYCYSFFDSEYSDFKNHDFIEFLKEIQTSFTNGEEITQALMNAFKGKGSLYKTCITKTDVSYSYEHYRNYMELAYAKGKTLDEMINEARKRFIRFESGYNVNKFDEHVDLLDRDAVITFSGKHFAIDDFFFHGYYQYGHYYSNIVAEIEKRGGIVHSKMVKMADYLVICLGGELHDSKIRSALEWRKKGVKNLIVSDYQMWQAVFRETNSNS